MDKLNIKKSVLIFNIICLFIAASALIGMQGGFVAAEGEEIVGVSVTALTSAGIVDGEVKYQRVERSGDGFLKEAEINYSFSSAVTHYSIDQTVKDTVEGVKTPVPDNGKVCYRITAEGKVVVRLNAYDADGEKIAVVEKTIYSDNTAPTVPESEPMDKYYKNGSAYALFINTFASDTSDIKEVYYKIGDGEAVVLDNYESGISKTITDNTTVWVYYFDKADNCFVKEYVYDKFDSVPPPKPEIKITPDTDVSLSGGYAPSVTVSVDAGEDTQSGIKHTVFSVNGEAYTEYIGEFKLKNEISYYINAYSVDNVGNISEIATVTYNDNGNCIDATAPSLRKTDVSYDLTADKIASIRIEAVDTLSGLGYVKLRGSDTSFVYSADDVYVLDYDCYGMSSVDVVIADKAGNKTYTNVVFNYFDDDTISDKLKEYSDWYKTADFNKYTEKSATEIREKLYSVSVLLDSSASNRDDFNYVFSQIDSLISGTNRFLYAIETIPVYLSGALTYSVDESDFDNYIKGEEIKLTFNYVGNDTALLSKSGFGSGFCENFSIKIYYKGEEVESLRNGVKISLNMPVGFYERSYALFDCDTGEKIDAECINNKIEFTLKKSGSLSLAISGKAKPAGTDSENGKRSISVFGHKISLVAFVATVGGGALLAAAGIITVILVFKRRAG